MSENINVFENPKKELNYLVTPLLFASIISNISTLVDTAFLGLIGTDALAAIGLIGPLYALITAFGYGIGVGTNSLMSRSIGNSNLEEGAKIFNNSIFLTLMIGILLTVIIIFFNKQVLGLFGATGQIYVYASQYSVIFYGCIILLIQGILSNIFRVELKSKLITRSNLIMIILNVIFNAIFFFIFDLGVLGVGLATLLSSIIIVIFMICLLLRDNDWIIDYHINFKFFDINIMKHLLKIGIPAFIENSVYSVANIIINYFLLLGGGSDAVGIYSAAWKIVRLVSSVTSAYSSSLTTISSMFFGKEDFKTIKNLFFYAMRSTSCLGLILMVIIIIFSYPLASLVSGNNPTLCLQISDSIKILSVLLIILPSSYLCGSIFVSIDKPRISLLTSIIESLVLQVFFMVLFAVLGFGIIGVYCGLILGSLAAVFVYQLLFYRYFKNYINLQEARQHILDEEEVVHERVLTHNEDVRNSILANEEVVHERVSSKSKLTNENMLNKREDVRNSILANEEVLHERVLTHNEDVRNSILANEEVLHERVLNKYASRHKQIKTRKDLLNASLDDYFNIKRFIEI